MEYAVPNCYSILMPELVDPAVLDDPTKSFEAFRAQYPQTSAIREKKALLKQKYEAAKALRRCERRAAADYGHFSMESKSWFPEREEMSHPVATRQEKTLTAQIDKVRKQQAIADKGLLAAETNEASTATAEDVALENKLKDQIEQHNAVYKKGFNDLSELKKEIQHIQKLLAPQDGRQSFTQEAACPLEARVHVTHENRPSQAFTGVFVSAEDGVSGFYEALDVLKRRNARK
ncbi:hypothetical protein PINS_up013736 [Pythium insidiosum]|nr:hypothetical protein PINS_up013736 [Pythium insidiosum]